MSSTRILLAIPVFNCARQLSRVLESLVSNIDDRIDAIWVVDNGSTDETLIVADKIRPKFESIEYKVFQNVMNFRLGGTHKIVFTEAENRNFTHVIIFHGDDQGFVGDIGHLIDCSFENDDISIFGSRFQRTSTLEGYSITRILGNQLLNSIYSLITLRRLSDLGSGLNMFRLSDLRKINYRKFGNTMTFNYELTLAYIEHCLPFKYVSIHWSEKDQISNVRNFEIFVAALKILFLWRLKIENTVETPSEFYVTREIQSDS